MIILFFPHTHTVACAGTVYINLRSNHNIRFNSSVLSPLLQLCSNQHHRALLPKPFFLAHKVFDDLKFIGKGRVALADHLNLLHTLSNYHRYLE